MEVNKIDKISFDDANLFLRVNGRRYRVPIAAVSLRLARANQKQRESVRVSPSGFAMTWTMLDLEIQVSSLLQMGQPYWAGI
jgi:hypothetical protein